MTNKIFSKTFLKEFILMAIIVALLHKFALSFSLYWTLSWYDIMMHFLGGFLVGLGALFLFFGSGYIKATQKIQESFLIFLILIFTVLVIGLTWELWELFVGFTDVISDLNDTLLDLTMDILGCIAVFFYGKNKIGNEKGIEMN